ncbi:MAG: GDP-mannose 4,6-dehydratase, partial [Flavobacteriales bacterium]|nr:GDP-mannose 4,6-dehydratase [Flavobacteriales bacterium]
LITGNIKNLSHLKSNLDFEFKEIDITHDFKIEYSIDFILHFASPASPIDYLKIPLETLRVGSLGTDNILKLALKNNARILIASTSEVYGDPLIHPQPEEYFGNVNPVGPRGVYDEAKRYQEALTTAYHTFYGLDIRIARIFNTYGSRMRVNDGRAIPAFMGQVLRGESLTVFGDGSQTRSFCFIDDMLDGIYKLLHSNYTKPMNLGNPEEIALIDFAKEIIALGGTNNKLVFKPLPLNDPVKRKPDITKAIKILNWNPTVSRKKGLKITFNYFKSLPLRELNNKESIFE